MYKNKTLQELKEETKEKILKRVADKILEKENADFLIELIEKAQNTTEVLKISALGMTYKRTGFHFDVRLEKRDRTIKYFAKNEELSFAPLSEADSKAQSHTIATLALATFKALQKPTPITHKLIIGDNYPALLNLLINYKNKIKVIYIDPPYGKDNLGEFAKTNYDNAITRDNLLSMLYPRLSLARQLLKDDGVIFCSIDDRNQAYVKGLFDEVFGEGNFVCNFIWHSKNKPSGNTQIEQNLDTRTEYILCYTKAVLSVNRYENTQEELKEKGYILKDEYFETRGHYKLTPLMRSCSASSFKYLESLDYEIQAPDGTMFKNHQNVKKPKSYCYTWGKDLFDFGFANGFIEFTKTNDGEWVANRKMYEFCAIDSKRLEIVYRKSGVAYHNLITEKLIEKLYSDSAANEIRNILNAKVFDYPKPVNLIKHLLKISTTSPSDAMDLQADSIDCHDLQSKSRKDKGAYTNATTKGGGGNSRRIA